jgi:hypothetical protein
LDGVKSGTMNARANNVRFGRSKGAVKDNEKFLADNSRMQQLLKEEYSIRSIAKIRECFDKTVQTGTKVWFASNLLRSWFLLLGCWELDMEGRPGVFPAFHPDFPLMQLHELFDNVQAQASGGFP